MDIKTCKNCSAEYERPYSLGLKLWARRQFCSRLCRDNAQRGEMRSPRSIMRCQTCSNEFAVLPHRLEARYCSRSCHSRAKVGEKAANWQGGKPKCIDCPNLVSTTGAKRCRACSDIFRSGPNNPAWKGGVTPEQRAVRTSATYRYWRKHVFQRDDYTCQACGERGGKLNADHELPFALYPDLRFEILNGRTLCEDCHKKTPTYGNRRNLELV